MSSRKRFGMATWGNRALWLLAVGSLLAGAAMAAMRDAQNQLLGWLGMLAWLLGCALAAAAFVRWRTRRETARVQRDFARAISHQLRTPLAQIQMFTEMLLLRRDRSQEERSRWLETIEREAHRLDELLENVLIFVQAEAAESFAVRRETDLGLLIEDVAADCEARARPSAMRIQTDPPQGVLASVEPRAVRLALTNLLDNALRYGPAGQTVQVTLTAGSGEALICVQDEGPGIPEREQARIWAPFVRLAPATDPEGGCGLGLAVVREVARAHGGRAYLQRGVSGGSVFCLALPLTAAESPSNSSPIAVPDAEHIVTAG